MSFRISTATWRAWIQRSRGILRFCKHGTGRQSDSISVRLCLDRLKSLVLFHTVCVCARRTCFATSFDHLEMRVQNWRVSPDKLTNINRPRVYLLSTCVSTSQNHSDTVSRRSHTQNQWHILQNASWHHSQWHCRWRETHICSQILFPQPTHVKITQISILYSKIRSWIDDTVF